MNDLRIAIVGMITVTAILVVWGIYELVTGFIEWNESRKEEDAKAQELYTSNVTVIVWHTDIDPKTNKIGRRYVLKKAKDFRFAQFKYMLEDGFHIGFCKKGVPYRMYGYYE